MKRIIIIIGIAVLFASCSTMIKSSKDIGSFDIKVQKIEGSGNHLVLISGVNLNSALWIEKYEVQYLGSIVEIRIYQSLKNSGYSGPYAIQFEISQNIKKIRIGQEIVWERQL